MKRTTIALVLLALLTAAPVSTQQVVFVVRHAERASSATPAAGSAMMADDPPLSPAGEQRASRLAVMLAAADIRHIFTSEYRRTKQTAEPIAKQLSITPVSIAAKDPDALIARVRGVEGNALTVGHSNTIPDLLKKLGVAEAVTIADDEYDNVFLVFRNSTGPATLVRLKY